MMNWIYIFLLLCIHYECSGQLNYQKCCNEGTQFAKNALGNSTININFDFSVICSITSLKKQIFNETTTQHQSLICIVFARACCLKIYSAEVCKFGASQTDKCEASVTDSSLMINQIKMECCLCCQENGELLLKKFESCTMLKGECPQKTTIEKSIYGINSTDLSSANPHSTKPYIYGNISTESISLNESVLEQISSHKVEPNLNYLSTETIQTAETFRNTISQRFKSGEILNISTIIGKTGSNNSTTINSIGRENKSKKYIKTTRNPFILCEKGKKWDSQLHVCVELLISCPKNFILHPNTTQCVPIVSPKKPCQNGYIYNQFSEICIDIDECKNADTCRDKWEECTNKVGSFKCECKLGFKHNKFGICEDFDECINMDICTNDKKCKNTVGSYKCVRSIPCGFGWKEDPNTNDCIDVDECEAFPEICGTGMKCVNIRGSHRCEDDECPDNMKRNNKGICSRCKDGFYFKNGTQKCEDIDECSTYVGWYKGRCKDTEVCFNLLGSYDCIPKKKCRAGTILTKNGTSCDDINECKQMKFRCESDEICINTYSSYRCIASPCAPSEQFDYIVNKCVCREGYQLSGDSVCTDIDECTENGGDNLCGSIFMCINRPGTYTCIHRAECPTGMFRSSPHTNCQDIDECETGEGKCPQNMHCVNVVGSYKCMCDRGFIMLVNNTCADVNECLLFRPEESCPDLEARCVNTAGSYKCQCPKGFQWSEYPARKCSDIDECLGKNPCGKTHQCINTIGSYRCKCFQGYQLSLTGDTCEDIDECLLEPRKCLNGQCINLPGRYICKCPQGFTIDKKEICQDIDECASHEEICTKDDDMRLCINLLGYYKCVNNTCPRDYTKQDTGNGYICVLKTENRCKLNNATCLENKPYKTFYEFMEISSEIKGRLTLSRFNMAHLPPGTSRINLHVKHAFNTDTKQPVTVRNVFQLVKDRYNTNNIEIIMKRMVKPPTEVLLYLNIKIYHQEMYFGHSDGFVYLYFTQYPQIINQIH